MSDINHAAVKVWALEITADEYGNPLSAVAMAQAYLDLAAQLESANANADELQSRLDTVTASHCEMLRELQAERHRVKELDWLVKLAFTEGRAAGMNYYEISKDYPGWSFYESSISTALTRIMEGRDNG